MADSKDDTPGVTGETHTVSNDNDEAADGEKTTYTDVVSGGKKSDADKAVLDENDPEAPSALGASKEDGQTNTVAFTDSTKEEKRELLASSGLTSSLVDGLPFESHFTVRVPTSTLQYRGALLRVIDTDGDQIILSEIEEEDDKKKMLVKRMSPETLSQTSLRIGYTLVTILFCGFLFVFCFQVLLLLLIAVQVYSNQKAEQLGAVRGITIVSTLLAFPLMLYSMSSLMAMGSGECFYVKHVVFSLA